MAYARPLRVSERLLSLETSRTSNEIGGLKEEVQELDKKVDVGFASAKGGIKRLDQKIDSNFDNVTGEIKRLDQKIDLKIDGWKKRLETSEFVGKASVTAIFIDGDFKRIDV
ncbi:MAG: hypothetical protein GDA44_00895 [Prochloron sp. SP5CPC1]|nr:hypothetical protein [Candidatus Paraprochloron terpiosi SP5CPC1]